MAGETHTDPAAKVILVCYDGSAGSHAAIEQGAQLLVGGRAVVLVVWETVELRLARMAVFGGIPAVSGVEQADDEERRAAQRAADEGAGRARDRGFTADARVEQATESVWRTICDVADELDADLIVLGHRGRGTVRSAVLGSTAQAVLQHARRPVLVSPEPGKP